MDKRNMQYRRTDRAIVQGFLKLLEKKPYEKITVQEILEEALVSRNTFYLHYRDKADIAEKLYHDFIQDFQIFKGRFFEEKREQTGLEHELETFEFNPELMSFLQERRVVIRALSRIQTDAINIKVFIRSYFKKYYEDTLRCQQVTRDTFSMEANMYAALIEEIAMTSIKSSTTTPFNVDKIARAIARASIFAMGVRDHQRQQELLTPLFEQMRKTLD